MENILSKLISTYHDTPNCHIDFNNDLYQSYTFYYDTVPTHLLSHSLCFLKPHIKSITNTESDISILAKNEYLEGQILFVLQNRRLFILDADNLFYCNKIEKLQTCDFKRKQYQKLVKELGLLVSYIYVLNSDWFDKPAYKDVLEYIESVNCNYCFDKLPLEWLGLPKPLKNK